MTGSHRPNSVIADFADTPIRDEPVAGRSTMTSRRGLTRRIVAAAVSAAVVALGALYVLGPSEPSTTFSADEVRSAQSFDATASAVYTTGSAQLVSAQLVAAHRAHKPRRPTWTETLYGRIDVTGVPVSALSLRITGAERTTRGQGATIALKANRTYRAVLHLRPGRYTLVLSFTAQRRHKSVSVTRSLRDHRYYRIRATVRPSGAITFLPVTSY